MDVQDQHLESLRDIKQMMQKSSRFISLSGLSGIAAGICALIGAFVAHIRITSYDHENGIDFNEMRGRYIFHDGYRYLENDLLIVGALTFIAAFCLAFMFTYLRSRKTGVPIWGFVARKLMVHVTVPMIVGGLAVLRLMMLGVYGMIAPLCLLFYGLALINASKFTFTEIKWLGYAQLALGAINLWIIGYGLYFWAIGFGVLHIIYGFVMWWKYERNPSVEN